MDSFIDTHTYTDTYKVIVIGTQVQILDEAIWVSFRANFLGKNMDLFTALYE